MATRDKPNSNLFGTDYNAEEEERKRLEAEASSAAQSAMMGAGGVPATAFGQAAASNLFQGATTFQDISEMQGGGQGGALNAEQGARDLRIGRQYESGGPVTLADMGSLMQAPQSAMMGAGVVSDLDSNILSQVPGIQNIRNPGAFDPANIEPARPIMSAGTAGRDERTTPREFASQSISSAVEGLRDVVGTESVSMEDYQAKQAKQAKQATQDAQGTLGVDQALQDSTGTSLSGTEEQQESPELEIRQGEEGSPQKAFNDIISERPLTPEEIRAGEAFADRRGFDFNPQTGFSTITDPGSKTFDTPATLENFQNRGLNLGQFMRYEDDPSQRTEQFVDPQGRLRRRLTPSAAALQGFEPGQQPLAPEFAQAEATGDQMIADLRAEEAAKARGREGPSMSDYRYMVAANEPGATRADKARGRKAAADNNLDFRTGQPLPEAPQGLTFDQQLSLRKQNFAEGKFDYELAKDAKATYAAGIEASQKATTEEAQADTAGRTMVSAISNMNDAMTRMGGRSGEFFGSGFFGKASSFIPGTSAYDQVADVEFLQSNVALNAMAELKELSPTGSTGFGALSEKELRVLTDKYANLNPFTSPDLFQSNLKQLQGEFNNMLNNAWNKHSKEYSPEAANAIYGNRGGSASGATGTPGQAIPNDRNITSAADTLLSDPKYN